MLIPIAVRSWLRWHVALNDDVLGERPSGDSSLQLSTKKSKYEFVRL